MLNYAAGTSVVGYNLTRSLRFRASATAFLSRTNGTSTNPNKFTWSSWVKRGTLGTVQVLMNGYQDDSNLGNINFVDDCLQVARLIGGSVLFLRKTNAVFRDPSAWYHIVVVFDNANATVADRVQIYVNGVLQTYSISNDPSTSGMFINFSSTAQRIARSGSTASPFYFDGYMAETYLIDGQALTPSSFGSTNALTGVWQPAPYTGTYGTNGFYLKFTDNSTAAALGTDFSGNSNTWTVNNISVTAGVTYDSMTDVPTLTSATASNFPTLNPLAELFYTPVLKNANLTTNAGIAVHGSTMFFPTTGKFYVEFTIDSRSNLVTVGLCNSSPSRTQWLEYTSAGNRATASGSAAYGASYTTGDVIGMAVDCTGSQVTFYKNNSSQGAIALSVGSLTVNDIQSQIFNNTSGDVVSINFGQRPFTYTPPTGFVALNAFNLPTATILKGNTVMDATLYTGNGSTQTITNAAGFQPDLVWVKVRSAVDNHKLTDSVRGVTKGLISNSNGVETTDTNGLTAFNSNGWSLGSDTAYNTNGSTYVGWQWQAGGAAASNTNGTITSQVSVNASAGFSVVTYTGTGAAATVGHGLGVAPSMLIVKNRSATSDWYVYHAGMATPSNNVMFLNGNGGNAASTAWNNTAPTSSVFSLGNLNAVNGSGNAIVSYCFAPIAGFSAFGSYIGNGSADGPFVYMGFRPKFVIVKVSSSSEWWYTLDSTRDTYNPEQKVLSPSLNLAESNTIIFDFLSNGIKIRNSGGFVNTNGANYIYMAFAENPFKNSLAR